MYRLLTVNRVTVENFHFTVYSRRKHVDLKYFDKGRIFSRGDAYAALLQPAKYHTMIPKTILHQSFQFRKPSVYCSGSIRNTTLARGDSLLFTARSQSTTPTKLETNMVNNKSAKKPDFSKYIEILEVTKSSANEHRSRVTRLKAKKLQSFINRMQQGILKSTERKKSKKKPITTALKAKVQDNFIMTAQQKAPKAKKSHTKSNNNIRGCSFDDKPMIFVGKGNTDLILNKNFYDTGHIQQIIKSYHKYRIDSDTINAPKNIPQQKQATVLGKPKFKSKIHHNEVQELLAKELALRVNLTIYLNVCVSIGSPNRGFSTLLSYRKKTTRDKTTSNFMTIDLYNILLHGYAEKGSFHKFKEIFDYIEQDGLKFNEQTFAAIFVCLGRLEMSPENTEKIQMYIKKAENINITLNSIMDKSKFISDQRDIALDAIHRVYPDFKPIYTPPVLTYNNTLLNCLNKKVLPAEENIYSTNKKTESIDGAEIMNSKLGYNKEQLEEMGREQLKIELEGSITIKSIEQSKEIINPEYYAKKINAVKKYWRSQITSSIVRNLNTMKAQIRFKPQACMIYYTYLKALNASEYADILIKEIFKLAEGSEMYSPTIGQLHKNLGKMVQERYQIKQKMKNGILEKVGDIYCNYCDVWDHGNTSDNTRQIWQRLIHRERVSGASMDIAELSWPRNVLIGVGRFLFNILLHDIKIDLHIMRKNQKECNASLVPAFYTLFRNKVKCFKEEVKPHPVLSRFIHASRQQTLTFESNLVPMLCPTQPWTTTHNGGYLLNKSDLIRLPHQAIQQMEVIKAVSPQNMYPALDTLNQLGSVPWRVNTDILDVIIEVFQNGGDSELDVPQHPSSLPPVPSITENDSVITNAQRAKFIKDKMAHRRQQSEMYSLWCDALYRISLANHYRDKVFWLPHNMDFRGRVYPIPPHLNHMGSDLARCMLIFDQPKPLGVDGFSWLKLHCVNLTGLKKRDSIRERLLFAEEIMPEILDSADKPLTGRQWWKKSDEPWQTLSCCIEIAKVYRSPNPEEFLSRFPVHQDGSCNGLQHYAALGRDKAGALSVNLTPSSIPQDVYTAVASLVDNMRKKDAQNGVGVAKALAGFVTRKVIKQTVMTTVYGVTRYGARIQIARKLEDIDDFPKEWVWPASNYLTSKTFESLGEMFTSTREIQDWFTDCASLVSGVCGHNVEWITPLGLPVVQPYIKQEFKSAPRPTTRVSETMSTDMYELPNVMKQKNAFPPNFIHSLDSSHMMLTSLHCERDGLTFISVHDCFWTHACTVPQLNKICREQFIALHSQPILEDLSKFLRQKYSYEESDFCYDDSPQDISRRYLNRVLSRLPHRGDFDLRNVLDSVYFFS